MYQIKIYMVMILNRGYLLGLKDWSWPLSHEQRKKVFWFTYSTSDGAFYSQRNYTNPRRQVPPLRSRDQILVEIYDSEEKGFILPRFLWTRSNFFFFPILTRETVAAHLFATKEGDGFWEVLWAGVMESAGQIITQCLLVWAISWIGSNKSNQVSS